MRARIRTRTTDLEYRGGAALWNELLRPIVGGPEAPEETARPPAVEAPAEERVDHSPAAGSEPEPATGAPPRAVADALLAALAGRPGRRSEKDAVLVAVWALDGSGGDVGFGEVHDFLSEYDPFAELRVKPLLLKHVSRSRLLAFGAQRETVRLTAKGRRVLAELARFGPERRGPPGPR